MAAKSPEGYGPETGSTAPANEIAGSADGTTPDTETASDEVVLPVQSHYEVALELDEYDSDEVERLFQAVWPERSIPDSWSDLVTETASNMGADVRAAFTRDGVEAAIDVAEAGR